MAHGTAENCAGLRNAQAHCAHAWQQLLKWLELARDSALNNATLRLAAAITIGMGSSGALGGLFQPLTSDLSSRRDASSSQNHPRHALERWVLLQGGGGGWWP